MTIRNLDKLLEPRSVAIIGSSKREGSVGAVLTRNLFHGDFDGPVMPVNPKHKHIQSVATYPDVAALPVAPDLAVIATPPDTVPGLIAELGARGAGLCLFPGRAAPDFRAAGDRAVQRLARRPPCARGLSRKRPVAMTA